MKYIRTKDGKIFDTTKEKISLGYHPLEAHTIKELCDEFVIVRENGQSMTTLLDLAKEYAKCGIKTYGAIWTDKGLIYVAKMNEKGELELL